MDHQALTTATIQTTADEPPSPDHYVLDGFVVNNDSEESIDRPTPLTDIDPANIVTGKRRRRATRTIYTEPEFQSSIAHVLLADVPDSELPAVLTDNVNDVYIVTDSDDDDGKHPDHDQEEHSESPVPSSHGTDEQSDDEYVFADSDVSSDDDLCSPNTPTPKQGEVTSEVTCSATNDAREDTCENPRTAA